MTGDIFWINSPVSWGLVADSTSVKISWIIFWVTGVFKILRNLNFLKRIYFNSKFNVAFEHEKMSLESN